MTTKKKTGFTNAKGPDAPEDKTPGTIEPAGDQAVDEPVSVVASEGEPETRMLSSFFGYQDRERFRNEVAKDVFARVAGNARGSLASTGGGNVPLAKELARSAVYAANCLIEEIDAEDEKQAKKAAEAAEGEEAIE